MLIKMSLILIPFKIACFYCYLATSLSVTVRPELIRLTAYSINVIITFKIVHVTQCMSVVSKSLVFHCARPFLVDPRF